MAKNDKTLGVNDIDKKKKELESDLEKIHSQIQNLDKNEGAVDSTG